MHYYCEMLIKKEKFETFCPLLHKISISQKWKIVKILVLIVEKLWKHYIVYKCMYVLLKILNLTVYVCKSFIY